MTSFLFASVCQRYIDIKFKPFFGIIKLYVYFVFLPRSSKIMEHSTKRYYKYSR